MARLSHDPATGITRFFAYPKPGAIVLKASTLAGGEQDGTRVLRRQKNAGPK